MNNEQFDNIGAKIKQAAMQSQPAYTEEAWAKMEKMLDDDDRRKRPMLPLWIFYTFLVLSLSAMLFWLTRDTDQTAGLKQAKIGSAAQAGENIRSFDTPSAVSPQAITGSSTHPAPVSIPPMQGSSIKNYADKDLPLIDVSSGNTGTGRAKTKRRSHQKQQTDFAISNPAAEEIGNGQPATKDIGSYADKDHELSQTDSASVKNIKPADGIQKVNADTITQPHDKKQTVADPAAKKGKGFRNKFFIGASVGAELSGVTFGGFKNSSPVLKTGVMAGYRITDRLSVMLGMFTGKKIYSAQAQDYHPKAGSYLNYVRFTGADADCRVYDIPLNLRYDIRQAQKMSWFVSAGLSSYIMKSEKYTYKYIYYNRPYLSKHSYTGNSTVAAALNFSAGLERKMSNKFSLLLEPSLSVPLRGVGDGSVKLYSSSFSIGVKYFPFKKG